MALSTAFTELFSVQHPIALAPMGGSAGGALTAAVSNGGGLGLLGGGAGNRDWLDRELPLVAAGTSQPWGVGFQSWAVDVATVERALQFSPRAVMLSFGDPRPFTGAIRQAGVHQRRGFVHTAAYARNHFFDDAQQVGVIFRSEERRVGKEC